MEPDSGPESIAGNGIDIVTTSDTGTSLEPNTGTDDRRQLTGAP